MRVWEEPRVNGSLAVSSEKRLGHVARRQPAQLKHPNLV